METATPPPPTSAEPPGNDTTPIPQGLGPTPDPTRSGALWVGGAGVALLLAAAGVLTAVRWDDIGQSAKLGGLVAITMLLLGAGQKFRSSIPMTAQAMFHLGALLIPFDMAAVAILAGRSWQETLLLTSVTSVIGWYSIERAVPSVVLRWSGHAAIVALAAGVAAMSQLAMPIVLAGMALLALVARQAVPAGAWAMIAGILPLVSAVPWPVRLVGSMAELGLADLDQWQSIVAGLLATLTLAGVAQHLKRPEIAWSAVSVAAVTVLLTFVELGSAQVTVVSLAALFLALELLAMFGSRDLLWRPIVTLVALAAELAAGVMTVVLALASLDDSGFNFAVTPTSFGVAAVLVAVGWLTADQRRLDAGDDWLLGLVAGSDWLATTVMFPIAALAAAAMLGATDVAVALVASALAYWMVATWRSLGAYGATVLVAVAAVSLRASDHWISFTVGAIMVAILMLAAQQRVRARDSLAAVAAASAGSFFWLLVTQPAIDAYATSWPALIAVIGAWAMSWIVEARGADRVMHPAEWAGRVTAGLVVLPLLIDDAEVALASCAAIAGLAAYDYTRVKRASNAASTPVLTAYALIAGAALGLAGMPTTALAGLEVAPAGATLAVAGFVLIGLALVAPTRAELPLGMAAVVATALGLAMASGDAGALALAVVAAGCSTVFIAAAVRDLHMGIAGYVTVSLGAVLGLAVLDVTWLEAYLALPALGALGTGYAYHCRGGTSWAAYSPTIGVMSYVAMADRFGGGSAWHAVIAGGIGVAAVIAGGYRRLVGPLVTGSGVLAIVVGYESLGPAALVPTWAWLALGGTVLLGAGVAIERSDSTPLERGQQIRTVIATQFS